MHGGRAERLVERVVEAAATKRALMTATSVASRSPAPEVCCAAHQRKKLESLRRYITRPGIANERLALNRAGQVVLTLKTPYR